MNEPPYRFRQIPACHYLEAFVWRPSPHEPYRPYNAAEWFRPANASWTGKGGKSLIDAVDFADKANVAAGYYAPQPQSYGDRLRTLLRRLTGHQQPEPDKPRRLPRHLLPPPTAAPLRRPSPEALVSLLHQHQRHNAPPHPDIEAHGWGADNVLTQPGYYTLSRALMEAPLPFLRTVFDDFDAERHKYDALLQVAITALEYEHPTHILHHHT